MFSKKSIYSQILLLILLYTIIIFLGVTFFKNYVVKNVENKIKEDSYYYINNTISILIEPIIENKKLLNKILKEIENTNHSIINIVIERDGKYYTNIEKIDKQYKEPLVIKSILKNGKYLLKVYFSQNYLKDDFKILNFYYISLILIIIISSLLLALFIRFLIKESIKKEKEIYKIVTKKLNTHVSDINIIKNIESIINFHKNNEQTIRKLKKEFEENLNIKTSILLNEIKDKQMIEDKLKNSLEEKTILLREIHHRVKNNLAIISSLIRLQSRKIEDLETKNIFINLINRIKTIELIHSNLYNIDDFANIDFKQYLISLTNNLKKSLSTYNENVKFDIECKEIDMNVDQALACGQIINEIVTNSFKYAFSKNQQGIVFIKIELKDDIYTLSLWDNGTKKVKINQNSSSLGIKLINELIKLQLKGHIEINEDNQYKYRFFFKKM